MMRPVTLVYARSNPDSVVIISCENHVHSIMSYDTNTQCVSHLTNFTGGIYYELLAYDRLADDFLIGTIGHSICTINLITHRIIKVAGEASISEYVNGAALETARFEFPSGICVENIGPLNPSILVCDERVIRRVTLPPLHTMMMQ